MNNKKYDGVYYEWPYVETLKEVIENTVAKYPDRTAYMYKDVHKDPFQSITYKEFDVQRRALGTALLGMGLKDSKIAVTGENSHRWVLSYFTVVTGVGVIVPIDKSLQIGEIENLPCRCGAAVRLPEDGGLSDSVPGCGGVPSVSGNYGFSGKGLFQVSRGFPNSASVRIGQSG